jgi:tetraacyldisaccharide 4'-kinase
VRARYAPDVPVRPEDRLARRGGAVELLRAPALLFGAVARLRGALYDRGWLPSERLPVPIVCVGNLTAGGTGKTPMVAWVARELARRGLRPGVVSRGYGARVSGGASDESALLAVELPGVPHASDRERARAGRELIERGCGALVLDDGFQHRRLQRDLDLVLVDATRPWGLPAPPGGGEPVCALLPRGLLREPLRALARAGAVVLTRVDQAEPRSLARLRERLLAVAPGVALATAEHRPRGLRRVGGPESLAPQALRGERVELVSGIGNPDAFERSARDLGAEIVAHRRFGDHHDYAAGDLEGLGRSGARVVTTAKDAVKVAPLAERAGLEAWTLEVEIAVREGASVLAALLDSLPEAGTARERRALHGGLAG